MIIRRVGFITGILLMFTTIFVIFDVQRIKYNTTPVPNQVVSKPRPAHIDEKSIFILRAYARNFENSNTTTVEILTLNQCLPKNFSLSAQIGSIKFELSATPIEACPWAWAPGCKVNAYLLSGEIPTKDVESEILIDSPKSSVSLRLTQWKETNLIKGTTICVPPLYWYTDWAKLLLWLEWWKAQGIKEMIIYYYSSSETVKKILDHYTKEGLVRLVEWPLMPSDSVYEPNNSVYRLSHSLAHNDCLRQIRTEYGILIDVDELIVSRYGTPIPTLIDGYFSSTKSLGSLSFQHVPLIFNPPLETPDSKFNFDDLDYRGIGNVSFGQKKGPMKVAFRTSAIRRLQTHFINEYVTSEYSSHQISKSEAVMLHNRYTYVVGENEKTESIEIVNPQELESFRQNLVAKKNAIYPNGANFDRETQRALGGEPTRRTVKTLCWAVPPKCKVARIGPQSHEKSLSNNILYTTCDSYLCYIYVLPVTEMF